MVLATLLNSGYLWLPRTFYSFDDRLRDFWFVLRGPIATSHEVVIVDIDEKSLQRFGRWPWPRKRMAQLLKGINDQGALMIGLDLIFPEADHTSPHLLASSIDASTLTLENYDAILAQTLHEIPVVGGYLFLFEPFDETREPHAPYSIVERHSSRSNLLAKPQSVLLDTPQLYAALPSSGFLNNIADEDGMVRSVPLLMRYHEQLYLSMASEVLRRVMKSSQVVVNNSEAGVTDVVLGDVTIPTNRFGAVHVNFRGPAKHFSYVSAAEVLSHTLQKGVLRDKIVLVGTSALGLGDIHATPTESAMAGVEIHANLIDNIIQGDMLVAPADDIVYNMALITAMVLLSVLLFSYLSRMALIPVFVTMSILLYFFYDWLLFERGIILNILFVLLAFILGVVAALLIDYIDEARQKQQVEGTLKATNATMLEQSRSAALGEMVGMIAHQWRQPLSSMSAISSKVKLKGQLGKLDSVDKDMDEVVDLTHYLSDTIEDFRNFFKEDKSFEVTPLELVVERSVRFTSHLLKIKDVMVSKNLSDLSARLNVNEITQVLINLIKNAVDAYEERNIQTRTLHFEAEAHDETVCLHVSDIAGGLDEEKLQKIFEKNYSTKGAEGTGLGLYMCKKIIEENHHATLHVSNEAGGLRFTICFQEP